MRSSLRLDQDAERLLSCHTWNRVCESSIAILFACGA